MEFVATPIPLKQETRAVLEEIRGSTEPTPVYGLEPDQAQKILEGITEPMLEGAALPVVLLNQYRWYVRELAKLFRTRFGYALSFQLGLVLRKWAAYGLETNTMQFLLCEIHRQLKLRQEQTPGMPGPAGAEKQEARC